jgi:hypothetical protein
VARVVSLYDYLRTARAFSPAEEERREQLRAASLRQAFHELAWFRDETVEAQLRIIFGGSNGNDKK